MIQVNDVTTVYNQQSQMQSNKVHSSITPFHKVLESETDAVTKSNAVTDTGNVKSTDTAYSTEVSNGKVSLKSIFKRASEKYDISYDFLLAVAKAESDFNPKCVSSAGAKGIMQLMPDECKEFGVSDPYDPEKNIMASAKLLAAHLKKFNGDFTLAAAAYNAGSGAVKKYGGVPPYSETQNYVKKINRYMKEGVTVPDKSYKVEDVSVYSDAGTVSSKEKDNPIAGAVSATQDDLNKLTVSVGTGEDMVTMTYGAYLKYLELGSLGVG